MGQKVNSFLDIDLRSCAGTLLSIKNMFKVLTICRNTSVETLRHGFPDAFQLTWSVPDGIKCSYDAFP